MQIFLLFFPVFGIEIVVDLEEIPQECQLIDKSTV